VSAGHGSCRYPVSRRWNALGGDGRLLAPLERPRLGGEYTLREIGRKTPTYAEPMRTLLVIIGVLAILAGGTFFLQGIGALPGSFMTGDPTWAWIGGAFLIGGIALIVWSRGRSVTRP
jgi:hypothetical protein